MINRLRRLIEPPDEEPAPADDYFEVVCQSDVYYIARETAERISRLLGRRWPPRWIRFTDIWGADVRVPARSVLSLRESTVAQRQREREFRRARRCEDKADRRPWEDDDW